MTSSAQRNSQQIESRVSLVLGEGRYTAVCVCVCVYIYIYIYIYIYQHLPKLQVFSLHNIGYSPREESEVIQLSISFIAQVVNITFSSKLNLRALDTQVFLLNHSPVGWSCRIHQLHLCREVRFPQQVS